MFVARGSADTATIVVVSASDAARAEIEIAVAKIEITMAITKIATNPSGAASVGGLLILLATLLPYCAQQYLPACKELRSSD